MEIVHIEAGIGVIAGFLAGLFGIGGGIIVVPLLLATFILQGTPSGLAMHMAIQTSLACVFLTSLSSAFSHWRLGHIDAKHFKHLFPGLLLGVIMGVIASYHMHASWLKHLFAVMLIYMALRLWLSAREKAHKTPLKPKRLFPLGAITGLLSGLLGIGGGSVMVPILGKKIRMKYAAGLSSAGSCFLGLTGTLTALAWHSIQLKHWAGTGLIVWHAALFIGVFGIVFAHIGAMTSRNIPNKALKKIFAAFLVVVAMKMVL